MPGPSPLENSRRNSREGDRTAVNPSQLQSPQSDMLRRQSQELEQAGRNGGQSNSEGEQGDSPPAYKEHGPFRQGVPRESRFVEMFDPVHGSVEHSSRWRERAIELLRRISGSSRGGDEPLTGSGLTIGQIGEGARRIGELEAQRRALDPSDYWPRRPRSQEPDQNRSRRGEAPPPYEAPSGSPE